MRRASAFLAAPCALLTLAVAPAEALPRLSRLLPIISTATPPPAAAIDFVAGSYAEKGRSYGSFTAMSGESFARNSPETCLWSNGTLSYAAAGSPCLTDLGIGVWQGTTNSFLYSQGAFSTQWALSSTTATDNTSTAPDGTNTASTIADNATASSHVFAGTVSGAWSSGPTYSESIFAKAGTLRYLQLSFPNSLNTTSGYANFDLVAGTVTANGGTLAGYGITPLANGWNYVWITAAANSAGSGTAGFFLINSPTATRGASYAGTGQNILAWGAQFEQGPHTPYCPSGAATCTRAADLPSISVPLGTRGTVLAQFITPGGNSSAYRVIGLASGADVLEATTTTTSRLTTWNGSTALNLNGIAAGTNATMRGAVAWLPGNRTLTANGMTPVQDAAAFSTGSTLQLGYSGAGANFLNSYLQAVTLYQQAKTPAQLQALTAPGYTWGGYSAATVNVGPTTYDTENAGKAWSLERATGLPYANSAYRFEVRPGDVWSGDDASKERSELDGYRTTFASGVINIAYDMTFEPGAANDSTWMVTGQLHETPNDGWSPPFQIEFDGNDNMVVTLNEAGANANAWSYYKTAYADASPLQRGHTYHMTIAIKFDPTAGSCVVTRDGTTIVNYSGPLGYPGMSSVYWKEGVYRHAAATTQAVDFANLTISNP